MYFLETLQFVIQRVHKINKNYFKLAKTHFLLENISINRQNIRDGNVLNDFKLGMILYVHMG